MDLTYRYLLTRRWAHHIDRTMLFVMLNPSTADETTDDPTIRRCMNFARREQMSGLAVVNLFAMRATNPADLKAALAKGLDAVGRENGDHIARAAVGAHRLVVAWGAHGKLCEGRLPLAELLSSIHKLECLGTTKDGSPRHPLYVRDDQPLIPWVPK